MFILSLVLVKLYTLVLLIIFRRRSYEHAKELIEGFSKKYACKFLVHYEHIEHAIGREKHFIDNLKEEKEGASSFKKLMLLVGK